MLLAAYAHHARNSLAGLVDVGSRLLDIALDSACVLCGASAHRHGVCSDCDTDGIALARCIRCTRCGLASNRRPCDPCSSAAHAYDRAVCGIDYVAPYDRLAVGLKFGARLVNARPLSRWLAETTALAVSDDPVDVVVAMPLSPARLAERGFNQARVIARTVARRLAVPLRDDVLRRTIHHAPVSSLDHDARAHAVNGAFVARNCAGLRVALVDDVMTTGATFNEAASALRRAGAVHVVACAALRTPRA